MKLSGKVIPISREDIRERIDYLRKSHTQIAKPIPKGILDPQELIHELKESGIHDPFQIIPLEFLRKQIFEEYRTGIIPESVARVTFMMFLNQNPGVLT